MIASVDAGYIMGMGCVKSGDVERMLILTDIEALMSSAEMGLMDAAMHGSAQQMRPRPRCRPGARIAHSCH